MKRMGFLFTVFATFLAVTVMAGGINVAPGFYRYYTDNDYVTTAENGNLDGRIGGVLAGDDLTIDEKAAIVDALASSDKWNVQNVETFKMFLGRKYKMSFQKLSYDNFSADDLFTLGYLMLIDKKSDNTEAVNLLEMAKVKSPQSQAVNLIYMLAKVNSLSNKADYCGAKEFIDSVKSNTSLTSDMKPEAVSQIYSSLNGVVEKCK